MGERNGLQARLAAAEKKITALTAVINQVTEWNDRKFPALTKILEQPPERSTHER